MARGRKPIPRTKEEALRVRKEQVRRNVQALRDRRKAGEGKDNENVRNGVATSCYGRLTEICQNESSNSVIRPPWISTSIQLHLGAPSSVVPHGLSTALSGDDAFEAFLPLRPSDTLSRDHQYSASALHTETNSDSEPEHVIERVHFASQDGCAWSWHKPIATEECTLPAHAMLPVSARVSDHLPWEINSALLTRRQFVAVSSALFVPASQGELEGFVDLGPHWGKNMLSMVEPSDVEEESLHPLCLLQIAHLKQDRSLLTASRYYYGQALQTLRKCRRSADVVWRQLFGCAMILGTYELFSGTDDHCVGWQCHLEGASSYLRSFSKFDESMTDISYFYYLEAECIFNALRKRKPSRLSMSTWWKISVDNFAGETYGSLLRLVTPLPAYLEQFDNLADLQPSTDTQKRKRVLLDYGFLLKNQYKTWFEDVTKNVPGFSYVEAADSVILFDVPNPAPSDVQYSFLNLWVARLYLLYWSSKILLLEAMTALVLDLSDGSARKENSPSPNCNLGSSAVEDTVIEAKMFATDICRSASFCLRPCNGIVGKSIVLLPLWVAQKHLCQTDSEQGRWCTTVLRRIGQDRYDGANPLGAVDFQD